MRSPLLRNVAIVGAGPLAALVAALLPPVAGEAIARHLCAPLTRGVATLAALLPVSASEVLLVCLLVGVVAAGTVRLRRRELPVWRRLLVWGLDMARSASGLVAAFYLLWGFGYAAPPLAARLGLDEVRAPASREVLRTFARTAIDQTNRAYLDVHESEDAGRPTTIEDPAHSRTVLRHQLDTWTEELPRLALAPHVRRPLKTLASSEFFHRMGISGVYSPFSGEAHIVASLPGCSIPQVTAHEMAHQRGVHREDEANFVAFLTCTSAPSPTLRYSGWLFAQRQALRALSRMGDPEVTELLQARLPGVQRDVDDLHAYWEVARGRTGRVATRVNHAYLRSQHVVDGVASYGRSLDLVLRWYQDPRSQLEREPRP